MNFVSAIISVALPFLSIATIGPDFGFAGGGGSSSGDGGSSSSYSSSGSGDYDGDGEGSLEAALVVFAIMIIAVIISYRNDKKKRRLKASRNNQTPAEKQIHADAARIFQQYQKDWTEFDFASIATYTTPRYHQHATLMLELLQSLHRVNQVSKLQVHAVYLLNPVNAQTPLPANIRVEFEFSGLDEVLDTATGKTLYKNHAQHITETWNFIYDGHKLLLDGISQPTESAPHLVQSLRVFADQHQMFYSPDWGRYALPTRGLIFSSASMRVADINNHVIGKWGNLLIQLYTYAEQPGTPSTYYLVGQITVPKQYLGVIVKSKKYKTRHKPDKTYQKFELEWPDFNQRYEVFAAKRDALPAFELLNPKFMAYLYDKNLHYNLEVADDSIYIFANVHHATEADYAELLDILSLAHQELKM